MLAIFSGVESPILDKSPWDSITIFIFFLSFLGSLLKQCILFEIFLQFSLPPPYTKLKLRKNSGLTRPILFVGWGEGLDLRELENAPETQKCLKTFVHDCRITHATPFNLLLARLLGIWLQRNQIQKLQTCELYPELFLLELNKNLSDIESQSKHTHKKKTTKTWSRTWPNWKAKANVLFSHNAKRNKNCPKSSTAKLLKREMGEENCKMKYGTFLVTPRSPHSLKPPRTETFAKPQSFKATTRKEFEKPWAKRRQEVWLNSKVK